MTDALEHELDRLAHQVDRLYQQGRYEQAMAVAARASDLSRQHLGEDHPIYARDLDNLALQYLAMGRYPEAEPLYRRALEIWRDILGEEHPDFAICLNNLATLYQEMARYAEAEPLFRQALDINRDALGENHPNYAQSLNNLAALYREMGRYAEAEPLYEQALEVRREALRGFSQSLNNLARLYEEMGDYVRAEPLYQKALEVTREALGEGHPDFATSLSNLAAFRQAVGDYAAAEPLYRQALEIFRKALGEDHPYFATIVNNSAALYREMGRYAEAEPLHRQALEIRRKALGQDHPDFAQSLNSLALLHDTKGNYADAELYYRQALEIRHKTLGQDHPDLAISLNNLALLHHSTGDYAEAEPLFRQALETTREALGEEHPGVATTLNNLARLHQSMGDYAKAEQLYRQALDIRRKALGEDHPDFATTLNNLAVLYQEQRDYAAAEPLYRQAIEVDREFLGENHPDLAISLNNLARLQAATHRTPEALSLMTKAAIINDRSIGQIFSISSESQRMAYLKIVRAELEVFLSLVLQYVSHSSAAVQAGLELVLRRKGIGAEALSAQREALLSGRYPHLEPKLKELTTLRGQIARKTLVGPGSEGPATHQRLLADWNASNERLEANLASQMPEMDLEQKLREADRRAVAEALPEGAVLVEFVRFDAFDFMAVPARGEPQWKPARYVAFVLPAGEPDNVRMIDLGEAEPIDQRIASFRTSITGEAERGSEGGVEIESIEPSRISVRSDRSALREAIFFATRHARPSSTSEELLDSTKLGSELRRALFDPLLPALGGRTRLFVAPDGDLARLPFEVLPGRDGGHLIDECRISYLGVGRDALRLEVESIMQPGPPLVAADPDFDLGGADDRGAGGAPFERLRGTRVEGERIAKLLEVEPLLGGRALEKNVKGSRSPGILHQATHGFFLPDAPRDPNKEQLGLESVERPGDGLLVARLGHAENPLLRSGLALAGANTWLKDGLLTEEAEDGLLTAEDVTAMDLLATELVVLSACETGLGEVHVGEGVYGLRRAFVLAGAKTLVMSLWKVPDEETQELMEGFYRRILEGQARSDALREAQLAMKAKHPDPRYWGAFICQGDPGPLPR